MASKSAKTRWLTREEQRHWRAYIRGTIALMAQLDRDLQVHHQLSLSEYEILVQLSEAKDRQQRMSELAASLNHSRSRLTHAVSRLEADGLVVRFSCPEDGRGIVAELTDTGFQRLADAAHTHVEGVRRYLVDPAAPEDFAAVGRVFEAAVTATRERPV